MPETPWGRLSERDWQTVTDGTVRFALIGLGGWTRDRAIPAIDDSTFYETGLLVSGSKGTVERRHPRRTR